VKSNTKAKAAGFKVSDFMTKSPHCIDPSLTLNQARQRLDEYRVRHLPVRHGGKVMGMLTDRDLGLLLSLEKIDAAHTTVEEVMVPDPFIVRADEPLSQVAGTMAERHIGSAVVCDSAGQVLGIFTATDGLKALRELSG